MKVIKTEFEGLLIFEPEIYYDERGYFYELWRDEDYKRVGIQENFVQDNISMSYKNVLRGLHSQKGQGQLVSVLSGSIFDVAVDMRPDSKTFHKHFTIELSGDNHKQLYMPPGFVHGFYVLSNQVVMSYKCTQYYNKSDEIKFLWNDARFEIFWPSKSPLVNQKDGGFCEVLL